MNHYPGVVIVKMEGRLGAPELDSFRENIAELLSAGQSQIVAELSGVDYLDAEGIEALLHCVAMVVRADGELKLAALSPSAEIILALTRASRFFEIFSTVEEAVASFDIVPISNGAEPWNTFGSAEVPDTRKSA